jgi:hypothetical protein
MFRNKHQDAHHCLAIAVAFSLLLALSACGTDMLIKGETGTFVVSPNSIVFGAVSIGQTATNTLSLFNGSSAPVEITQIDLAGQSFSVTGSGSLPVTIAAGGTSSLRVQFKPTTAGTATGQLTISSNSSTNGTAAIALSGTGITTGTAATLSALSCSSASFTGSGTDACTVALSGAAPSGGLSISLSSSSAAVMVPAAVTVPENATSATFKATVSPVTTSQTATLTATAGNVSNSFALQLNATASVAVPALSLSAASLPFGNVTVNTTSTQSVTLTSTGTGSVTVSAATLTGAGFTLSGVTLPVTLASGQTATLEVQFEPTTAGTATGQLTISSNSSTNGTATIALSGTGTAAFYAVNLSWNAPTSSIDPVAGYNIYRALSGSSTYVLLNSSIDTETSYVDSTVVSGKAFDYITKSLDAAGVESLPSNIFSVTIP